ncbi:hypothetical protein [Croceimicrobium sp.]|uniref:hypothetical protein n=1 Tax=Croceimicrobium sp. TaxID=2828340 RepID=UPI003BAB3DDC
MFNKGWGLGFGAGLKGLTAQVSYHFIPELSVRAELSGIRVEDLTLDIDFSGQTLRTIGNLDLLNTALVLDYFPNYEASSFHFFAGISYAFTNRMQGRGLYPEAVEYGELNFEGEEIGYVDVQILPAKWMPQFGVAFGRSRPKRRAGLRLEVGTYYWGAPKVQMEATRMLENTAQEADKLENNLSAYRWWPFLNLALNFRL